MKIIILLGFIINMCVVMSVNAANKCQSYRDKLQNIQIKQKQGHSAKRSVVLHQQEQKAWRMWMACKQGKLPSRKKTKNKAKDKSSSLTKPYKKNKIIQLIPGSAFAKSGAVVIKAEYQGDKQQAWLNYFTPLDKCKRPKSTQVFAFCLDDKSKQMKLFEEQYELNKKNK